MTQLQKIVAKAKILRKSYPNLKWTDLIKKASKLVTPAKKSVGAVKKKKTVKKSPARSLHKDTKSHNVRINVVSGVKKRSTSRSAESEKVRSTVKKDGFIMPHGYEVTKGKRLIAGVGNLTIDQIKKNNENIEKLEKVILNNKSKMKLFPYKTDFMQNYFKKRNKEISDYIKTLKKQNTALKKHIK